MTHHAYLVYTIALLTAAAFSSVLIVRTWRLRRTPLGSAFLGLVVCTFFYALGYAFELTCVRLPDILFWNKVQYLGVPFIPVFWLILATRYTGRDGWLTKPVMFVLFGLSAATLLLDFSTSLHHLFYRRTGLDTSGYYPAFTFEAGPWYWVHIAFANLAIFGGSLLLVGTFRHAQRDYRRQAMVILIGALFPWVGLLIYLFRVSPHRLDTSPLALAVSAPLFAWGLFRYKLFDLAPIAKESVFSSMKDGAVVLDALRRIVDYNPAAERVFPEISRTSIGRTLNETFGSRPELLELLASAGDGSDSDLEIKSGGQPRIFRTHVSPIRDRRNNAVGSVLMLADMSNEIRLRRTLQAMATTDDLTGALVRRHFLDLGRQEISRAGRYGRPLSLLIIDLDQFKRINDTWGHEAGDEVLRSSAGSFRNALRATDLLCRHGGEEFAVLLPETLPDQAVGVAERLRRTLSEQSVPIPGGAVLRITASIGITGTNTVAKFRIEDLIRAADRAMYKAKAAGRDRIESGAPEA
jgi:diguanylate cyclase (GGDEF)-like protein